MSRTGMDEYLGRSTVGAEPIPTDPPGLTAQAVGLLNDSYRVLSAAEMVEARVVREEAKGAPVPDTSHAPPEHITDCFRMLDRVLTRTAAVLERVAHAL